MVPGLEANGDNLGKSFLSSLQRWYVMYTHLNRLDEKIPCIFVFLSYRKNFVGTQKRVRISHDKRAIDVRAIEIRLYFTPNSRTL